MEVLKGGGRRSGGFTDGFNQENFSADTCVQSVVESEASCGTRYLLIYIFRHKIRLTHRTSLSSYTHKRAHRCNTLAYKWTDLYYQHANTNYAHRQTNIQAHTHAICLSSSFNEPCTPPPVLLLQFWYFSVPTSFSNIPSPFPEEHLG